MTSLACKIDDVVVAGYYVEIDSIKFIRCTIPSYNFLKVSTVVGIQDGETVGVSVTLDGRVYSASKAFKFIEDDF